MCGATYKIVRYYLNQPHKVVQRGLTLAEAQEHCKDPESSSQTCTTSLGRERTKTLGPWFDGYEEE